jgi:hypothetical protein
MAARRRRGLDGESADRAIINVTAIRVVVGHCPRDQVPDFTLDFLQGEAAIFVGVHRLEDALVGRLKFLQGDCPVTIAVHHGKEHPHHHAAMHPPGTSHHAPSAYHAHSWTPAPAPTRPVVPAHHPTIVFDIIMNGAARSLGTLELALLLLLHDLWLLRRRPLLGVRTDSATHQSERTSP